MHTIKYRTTEERLHPRRTKLQIPGWAGDQSPVPMVLTNMRGIAFLLGGCAIWRRSVLPIRQ